jgi:hypothetical protein
LKCSLSAAKNLAPCHQNIRRNTLRYYALRKLGVEACHVAGKNFLVASTKKQDYSDNTDKSQEAIMSTILEKRYPSFAEFYPAYLSEHSNRVCRELHFAGITLALFSLAALVLTGNPWWLLAGLGCAYGFAWIGHFGFEKNQPASLKQPLYSFVADWVMYWQMLTGQISF